MLLPLRVAPMKFLQLHSKTLRFAADFVQRRPAD